MKIIHFSDVHGDLDSLKKLREYSEKKTNLELLLFSGDLLGNCLNEEQVQNMHGTFNYLAQKINEVAQFYSSKDIEELNRLSFEGIIEQIRISKYSDESHKHAAQIYYDSLKEFDKKSEEQYLKLAEEIKKFPQYVFMIPGNWDTPQFFDIFEKQNLHLKGKKFKEVKIAGYGGSKEVPIMNPQSRTIDYSGKELRNFLMKINPDIVIIHSPPYGMVDEISQKNIGNKDALFYVAEKNPKLLLCGHVHKAEIKKRDKNHLIVNAGNLGKYQDTENYGTFIEIDYFPEEIYTNRKKL